MENNCNHDCDQCTEECEERDNPKIEKLKPNDMSHIKKVIGVVSGKGGVGKSFVTALLASHLSNQGFHIGVIDADITGPSIPKMFGIHGKAKDCDFGIIPRKSVKNIDVMSINLLIDNETDPVVWRGPILSSAVSQFFTEVIWKDIDYLLVDMPPGTADVSLTVFQSLPVDGIIIVTSPQELVSMIVEKSVKMANKLSIPILGIVENMSYYICPSCQKPHHPFGLSKLEELSHNYHIDAIAKLPILREYAIAADSGKVELLEVKELDPIIEKINSIFEE